VEVYSRAGAKRGVLCGLAPEAYGRGAVAIRVHA